MYEVLIMIGQLLRKIWPHLAKDNERNDISKIINNVLYDKFDGDYNYFNETKIELKNYLVNLKRIRNTLAHSVNIPDQNKIKEYIAIMHNFLQVLKEYIGNNNYDQEIVMIKNKLNELEKKTFVESNQNINDNIINNLYYFIKNSSEIIEQMIMLDGAMYNNAFYTIPDYFKDSFITKLSNLEEDKNNKEALKNIIIGKNENNEKISAWLEKLNGISLEFGVAEGLIWAIGKEYNDKLQKKENILAEVNETIKNNYLILRIIKKLEPLKRKILEEENISINDCIIRNDLISDFIKYQVFTYEKYEDYIKDKLIYKVEEQEKYLDEIFNNILEECINSLKESKQQTEQKKDLDDYIPDDFSSLRKFLNDED